VVWFRLLQLLLNGLVLNLTLSQFHFALRSRFHLFLRTLCTNFLLLPRLFWDLGSLRYGVAQSQTISQIEIRYFEIFFLSSLIFFFFLTSLIFFFKWHVVPISFDFIVIPPIFVIVITFFSTSRALRTIGTSFGFCYWFIFYIRVLFIPFSRWTLDIEYIILDPMVNLSIHSVTILVYIFLFFRKNRILFSSFIFEK